MRPVLVASQAAISLENTQLYADVRQREAKIRRLIDANFWNHDLECRGCHPRVQ